MIREAIWLEGDADAHEALEPVRGDVRADVLIVGAGLCGMLTAWQLLARGACDIAIVDARRIARGVSAHTTAKITAQHGLIYDRLSEGLGKERTAQYAVANRWAIDAYEHVAREIGADCDYARSQAHVYTLQPARVKALERECKAAQALGFAARLTEASELPLAVEATLSYDDQARFDPVRFLDALRAALVSRGVRFFENSPLHASDDAVAHIRAGRAAFEGGTVRFGVIALCTHHPAIDKPGLYPMRLQQSRSYVAAVEAPPRALAHMHIDEAEGGLSFRPYAGGVLVGGGDVKVGHDGDGDPYGALARSVREMYDREPVAMWWAQDVMTLDGIPCVGRYPQLGGGAYLATGFNKWGMTGSMAAARVLAETIDEGRSDVGDVFAPDRDDMAMQAGPFVARGADAAAQYVRGWASGGPVCTHMGCRVRHDDAEGGWDCPCHGSRYDEAGRVVQGPATRAMAMEGDGDGE